MGDEPKRWGVVSRLDGQTQLQVKVSLASSPSCVKALLVEEFDVPVQLQTLILQNGHEWKNGTLESCAAGEEPILFTLVVRDDVVTELVGPDLGGSPEKYYGGVSHDGALFCQRVGGSG